MDRFEICKALLDVHHDFAKTVETLGDRDFERAAGGKWSAGQQLDHLCRSVGPVALAFGLPRFTLRLLFGRANRPSRTYDEVVKKYRSKLESGGRASGRFVPGPVPAGRRAKLILRLGRHVRRLCERVEACSEADLDRYVLPHPLLGKLTLREMLYFTVYHAWHHQEITLRNLGMTGNKND